jgi:hypothetical protein
MTSKNLQLQRLMDQLELETRGWDVADHWPADNTGVGIAAKSDPRRLVYISVFNKSNGYYDYECEEPRGPTREGYATTATGHDVTVDELLSVLVLHLAEY